MNKSNFCDSVFFAANGYDGFHSEFESNILFGDYSRIYIIKGGPGTGKSSFMKKISSFSKTLGLSVLDVYCSSDSNSLDGVIITAKGSKIALVDGTAPHAFEPRLPFAPDIIINSMDGIDGAHIEDNKREILWLNEEKKYYYDLAYAHLKIAGIMNRRIEEKAKKHFDYEKANKLASEIAKSISTEESITQATMYKSAFGKDGFISFPFESEGIKKAIYLSGDGISEYITLNLVRKKLFDKIDTVCLCPLDKRHSECLYIGDTLICAKRGEGNFDCSEFCGIDINGEDKERIRAELSESRKYFKKTAEYHFKLEHIYTAGMSFSVYDGYEEKIKEYLSGMKQ